MAISRFKWALLLLACAFCLRAQSTTYPAVPTYNKDISRIMQAKCAICHRPGDIAPFSLLTYQDTVDHWRDVKRAVRTAEMPPWKPVLGHGSFTGDFGLTDDERQAIARWFEMGVPEGNPSDLPVVPPPTGSEWVLGTPDVIAQMRERYYIPGNADDTYRCFVIDPKLSQDAYVSSYQVLPGNKQVVHHVLLFIDGTGQSDVLDANEPGPGYTCFGGPGIDLGTNVLAALNGQVGGLGGWVPGSRPQVLPSGVAVFVPKGAKIIMQVHYHPEGRPNANDVTQFGLYFAKTEVQKNLRYIPVVNTKFAIPAGAPDTDVTADLTIPPLFDAKVLQIVPHMHTLGKQIRVEKIKSSGTAEDMIYINDWDFHWQGFYSYVTPVALAAGDRVKLTCTFASRPDKTVTWGEGTEDEMCLAFLGVTFDRFK